MVLRLNWLIVFSFLIGNFCFAQTDKKRVEFKTQQIQVGSKKISVEIAETNEQHQYGLMNRNSLPKDHGMLFIFKNEDILSFWMKNTYIDLAIAYFDKNKKIVDIQEMKATNQMMVGDLPSYPSQKPALYALEMTSGWFTKNKVYVGQKFSFLKK
jgi:uncharacterized membrane protein (UPF0127 family)